MTPTIAILGSLDTKGAETAYLADQVRRRGGTPLVVDTSAGGDPTGEVAPEVTAAALLATIGLTPQAVRELDRGPAMRAIAGAATGLIAEMASRGDIQGLLSAGGSNAALVFSRVAAGLPFGLPKVAVTTMAVVDARAVIGDADVTLLYPVADIDGLNTLTGTTLAQGAAAVVAMAEVERWTRSEDGGRPIAATMFGVTTPCVQAIRRGLEADGLEVIVFHANGTGGRSVEALAEGGAFAAVVDVTTTELADLEAGGELSAGPDRLSPERAVGVPRVVVPGAVDMANFGPRERVPNVFEGRCFHVHNDNVTLMRTTPEENVRIGARISRYVAARADSVAVLPLHGVSALDRPGGPFEDAAADAALFDTIRDRVPAERLREVDGHINDAAFADAVTAALVALTAGTWS